MKDFYSEALEHTRHPYHLAGLLNISLADARAILRHAATDLPGWGRLELQPHIISRRRAFAPNWPEEDLSRILENRRLHDQGRVTMCQGRDGEWVIQYAIPCRHPQRRLPYFYGGSL